MAALRQSHKMFGGVVKRLSHESGVTKTTMDLSVFLPPQASDKSVPAVYWLSGLTCTDENFLTKAGAQKKAAELGVALIMPDTSPRGAGIEGEDEAYDFGTGAGFYVNATVAPWSKNYNMFDYVTKELPDLVKSEFPEICVERRSISGHSMGGHGSLICALKTDGFYRTASAFSPIVNPTQCPWGQKAFEGYFGPNGAEGEGKNWDATLLAKNYCGPNLNILIDQGLEDDFYPEQLLTENFQKVIAERNDDVLRATIRMQRGYDHSYYFISTFIDDHLEHHAKYLDL